MPPNPPRLQLFTRSRSVAPPPPPPTSPPFYPRFFLIVFTITLLNIMDRVVAGVLDRPTSNFLRVPLFSVGIATGILFSTDPGCWRVVTSCTTRHRAECLAIIIGRFRKHNGTSNRDVIRHHWSRRAEPNMLPEAILERKWRQRLSEARRCA